jgi:thioredoxin-dependent peroxiredoxin
VRDEIGEYRRFGVQPLGVNPAPPARHAEYAKRLGLPFPLLSDPAGAIASAYGATRPGGGIDRSVYLIDRDGTVLFARHGSPGAAVSLESLGEP